MGGGWILGVTAVWCFVHFKTGIPGASFSDLLLPHRWTSYRAAIGDHRHRNGRDLLASGNYAQALSALSSAVRLSPANVGARADLAQVLEASHRHNEAATVLLGGLSHRPKDPAYLVLTLRFLRSVHRSDDIARITAEIRRTEPFGSVVALAAAPFAAECAYRNFDYRLANAILNQPGLTESPLRTEILARIEWDQGFHDLALARLQREFTAEGEGESSVFTLLSVYLRESDRLAELKQLHLVNLARNPASFGPRIRLLQVHDELNDSRSVDADCRRYLTLFRHDSAALLALGDFAAATGRPDLVGRVMAVAPDEPVASASYPAFLAEAQLRVGAYEETIDTAGMVKGDNSDPAGPPPPVLDGLRAIAWFGQNRPAEGNAALARFLSHTSIPLASLLNLSAHLTSRGFHAAARNVLNHACLIHPRDPLPADALVRLDLATEATEHLVADTSLLLRHGNYRVQTLRKAAVEIQSDRFLFDPEQPALLRALNQKLALTTPLPTSRPD